MDGQRSFASLDFAGKKKRRKRDVFLAEMATVVPWSALEAIIEPHYPKVGPQGRSPAVPDYCDVAHLLPAAMEQPVRSWRRGGALRHPIDARFCQLKLGRDAIPDETTILNFRHLLEMHALTQAVFEAVAEHLEARGALLRGGTIVDATLIAASPRPRTWRDPEMRSSKKGNQWCVCHEHRQSTCGAVLKRERTSRSRLAGAGFKPPGAAAFKRCGGERPGKSHPLRVAGVY